jgi:DNA polymerase-1
MILIIDGNNLAYRAFHTPQGDLTTKQGEPTGVILGFINSLKGLLEKFPNTTRIINIFDGGKAKWRKELYPEYKANRSYGKDPEEKAKFDGLFKQIDVLNDNLHLIGVHSIKVSGWEADDIISRVCKLLGEESKPGIVVTSDKDMLQLISDNITVYSPYRDRLIGNSNFLEETGVSKEAYIGYRSLVGDTSDNIIGVQGIGEKTAKNLMSQYGHIDNILSATGDTKKKLLKSKRTARIFEPDSLRRLAINNKIMNFNYVPDDDEVNKAIGQSFTELPPIDTKKVKEFLIRWQFVSILTNFMPWIMNFQLLGED